jgi:hypothetical protein
MKTRIQKWASYRKRIDETPEEKLPANVQPRTREILSDQSAINALEASFDSDESLLMPSGEKRSPYERYAQGKKKILIIQASVLLAMIIVFVLLWFLWASLG